MIAAAVTVLLGGPLAAVPILPGIPEARAAMSGISPAPGTAPAVTLATGDSRSVGQPAIPATCATVSALLTTGNEQFSAAAEQSPPDTARIQSALSSCAGSGKAVVLAPAGTGNAFLSGPLNLPGGVALVVDAGATLYASRNPANYQVSGAATCGTVASSGSGCRALLTVTGSGAAIMGTRSSSGSQGAIDGRGDQDILGTSTTWWALSQQAKTGGKQNNPRLIEAKGVNNLTVYDIDLVNAPIFHLYFEGGNGLTVWGTRIKTPAPARNTDGIDADSATNVTVSNSYIQDGDDGIAIKTNSGAAANMTVENSHFYGTHGMSIGSETQHGVTNILFTANTMTGVDSSGNLSTDDNGIRKLRSADFRPPHAATRQCSAQCSGWCSAYGDDEFLTPGSGFAPPSAAGHPFRPDEIAGCHTMANTRDWPAVARAEALSTSDLSARPSPTVGRPWGMVTALVRTAGAAPAKRPVAFPAPGRNSALWIVRAPHVGG